MTSCARVHGGKCCVNVESVYNSIAEIVKDYENNYKYFEDQEMQFYRSSKSFNGLISRASDLLDSDERKHSHQYRISGGAMQKLAKELGALNESDLAKESFDALYDIVNLKIGEIHGIGKLTVYDTSTRIGSWFGLEPDSVYLHRGAKEGAKNWLGIKSLPRKVDKSLFGKELAGLSPSHIENLLCIFKEQLKHVR